MVRPSMATIVGPQKARGAEILLEILRSEGTQFIFGNPGTTELPLIDALVVNPDFRYVLGLQEATAVGMADGYAQASGKPAFVNLHTSGGLGHGMGAIMNAKIARVPMVVTAGQQDLRHILADPLLAADLVGMAGPVAVDFQSLARSMGVEPTFVNSHQKIAEAVETALRIGKPHLIEIPVTGVAGK